MQNGNWIEMLSLNRIKYDIKMLDGSKKEGFLRFTKSQSDRYSELIKSKKDFTYAELSEIALNPDVNNVAFTLQQIEESLDLDEQKLLCQIWIDNKIANPRLSKNLDPNFF